MNRRHVLIIAAAVLLQCGTAGPTFAAHQERVPAIGFHVARSTAQRSTSLTIVTRYFDALDHQGWPGHDYQTLNGLYAANVTLVESLTTGRPLLHTGRQQVRAFDERDILSWYLDRTERLSPSVVLTIEWPEVKGPGHELDDASPWLTMFTLKNGKIVNLVWMPC